MRDVQEVDADLTRTTDAYKRAVDELDDDGAMALLDDINELLDERIHLPQQRATSA